MYLSLVEEETHHKKGRLDDVQFPTSRRSTFSIFSALWSFRMRRPTIPPALRSTAIVLAQTDEPRRSKPRGLLCLLGGCASLLGLLDGSCVGGRTCVAAHAWFARKQGEGLISNRNMWARAWWKWSSARRRACASLGHSPKGPAGALKGRLSSPVAALPKIQIWASLDSKAFLMGRIDWMMRLLRRGGGCNAMASQLERCKRRLPSFPLCRGM